MHGFLQTTVALRTNKSPQHTVLQTLNEIIYSNPPSQTNMTKENKYVLLPVVCVFMHAFVFDAGLWDTNDKWATGFNSQSQLLSLVVGEWHTGVGSNKHTCISVYIHIDISIYMSIDRYIAYTAYTGINM